MVPLRTVLRLAPSGRVIVYLALTLSCGDATAPPADAFRIAPDTVSLAPGEELQLRVLMRRADGTEREVSADTWESTSRGVAIIDQHGLVKGVGAGFASIYAHVRGRRVMAPAAVGKVTYRNVHDVVVALYDSAAWWPAIRLPAPAIALDDKTMDSNLPKAVTRWITTAYVGNRYYRFSILPDGQVDADFYEPGFLKPSGAQTVLVLIVDYGDTNIREALAEWVAAQDSVNGDHRALAHALGYESPLVQFDNITVVVRSDSTSDPGNPDSAYATLRRQGYEPDSFNVVVSLLMTPRNQGGGANTFRNFVRLGCMYCPTPPEGERLILTREMLDRVARVLYHHEIGHLWGWQHGWGGGPERTRIITNPALFGWTDTDGDGIPEIIDPTPYGMSPADTAGLGIGGAPPPQGWR